MPPTLVTAADPYTVYPGGVIAIRCASYLGGARGTLTTETDTRAANGTNVVVRDSQQVTVDWTTDDILDAYALADNTLEIDLSTIPELESAPSDGMRYQTHLSFIAEGDWDGSDTDTHPNYALGTSQQLGSRACDIAMHDNVDDTDFTSVVAVPKRTSHFVTGYLNGGYTLNNVVGDEILCFRAWAKNGTTIEFLLDQVILIPWVFGFGAVKLDQWRADDFRLVGGSHNSFGNYALNPDDFPAFPLYVDGADGGDDNGKFTWYPYPDYFEFPDVTGSDGGGDVQKKTDYDDAEYMARVWTDDGYYLANSETDAEASAHAYSLHGALHFEPHRVIEDDFSRTLVSGWGVTPEGYTYRGWSPFATNGTLSVDGSQGVIDLGGTVPADAGVAKAELAVTGISPAPPLQGARCEMLDLSVAGKFQVDNTGVDFRGAGTTAHCEIQIVSQGIGSGATYTGDPPYAIRIDLLNEEWYVVEHPNYGVITDEVIVHGPVSISWFSIPVNGLSDYIAFRIEVKRFILRAKVWDASGAEPGTWDYEGFRHKLDSGTMVAYPYDDNLELEIEKGHPSRHPLFQSRGASYYAVWQTRWDDITVDYDPYGDLAETHAGIEQPDGGTKVGEITIPEGAWHFVYWGQRDWTTFVPGDSPYLDFAAKVWNDPAAAELQRAQAVFWYFRSIHGGVVSMNWSSHMPVDIERIHA